MEENIELNLLFLYSWLCLSTDCCKSTRTIKFNCLDTKEF